MNDPFEVLGLPQHADEAQIRNRYLELVRQFSPERAPERFAEIRSAFDELRDPLRRLDRQMFSLASSDSLESLAAAVRTQLRRARLSRDALLALTKSP